MAKSTKVILGAFLLLAGAIVVAYVGHQVYLEHASNPEPTTEVEKLQERMRALGAARRLVREGREKSDPKRLAEGIGKLRGVMEQFPGSGVAVEARLELAKALAASGKQAEAFAHLEGVIRGAKTPRRAARALLARAEIRLPVDPAAARQDLQRLLDKHAAEHSLTGKARLLLGRLDAERGDFLAAIERFAPVTTTGLPESGPALQELRKAIYCQASKLADQGKWRELLTWCEKTMARFPKLPNLDHMLRYRQAAAHRMLGRFAMARRIVEGLRRDVPAELLDKAIDLAGELRAIAKAEEAAGVRRTRQAFLRAKKKGLEARKHVEGEIARDTTWAKADGPLVVLGAVTVKRGATLTLGPGLRLETLEDSRIVVEGALVLGGTADEPVLLTSAVADAEHRSMFDGDGIVLTPGSSAACRIEHCVIEYQRVGLTLEGVSLTIRHATFARNGVDALRITRGSKATIEACTLVGNDGTAIHAEGASPTVRRCLIVDNGRDGIRIAQKSTPTVERNRVARNGRDGVACDTGVHATIQGNDIAANARYGILCENDSGAVIRGNRVRDNKGAGIKYARASDCQITANAILGNQESGIVVFRSDGLIKHNNLLRNKPYGVNCEQAAAPTIEDNWIESPGNSAGVVCQGDSSPTITRNAILRHDPAPISNVGSLDVQAPNNYYGPRSRLSDKKLDRLIFDHTNMRHLGTVHWRPRLTAPPPRPPLPELRDLPDDPYAPPAPKRPRRKKP